MNTQKYTSSLASESIASAKKSKNRNLAKGLKKQSKGETVITLKGSDMSGLICTLEGTAATEVKPNSSVVIKGICTGFLTDVVLVRCVL